MIGIGILPFNFVHPRIIVFAVNCKWSDFGSWSNCSAPCGKGEQNRTRTVLAAASNGGNDCTGTHEEKRACKIEECPGTGKILSLLVTYCITKENCCVPCISKNILFPVTDCEWEDWKIGKCTETCGGGIRTNTRAEKVSATQGGAKCDGPAFIEETCNIQDCPGCEKSPFKSV